MPPVPQPAPAPPVLLEKRPQFTRTVSPVRSPLRRDATPLLRVASPHPQQRWVFAQPVQPMSRVLRPANRSATSLHDVLEPGSPVLMPSGCFLARSSTLRGHLKGGVLE